MPEFNEIYDKDLYDRLAPLFESREDLDKAFDVIRKDTFVMSDEKHPVIVAFVIGNQDRTRDVGAAGIFIDNNGIPNTTLEYHRHPREALIEKNTLLFDGKIKRSLEGAKWTSLVSKSLSEQASFIVAQRIKEFLKPHINEEYLKTTQNLFFSDIGLETVNYVSRFENDKHVKEFFAREPNTSLTRNRSQALMAYPNLSPYLMSNLTEVIDKGLPLRDAIMKDLGVSKEEFNNAKHVFLNRFVAINGPSLHQITAAQMRLKPGFQPKSNEELSFFAEAISKLPFSLSPKDLKRQCTTPRKFWDLIRKAGYGDVREFEDAFSDFTRNFINPLIFRKLAAMKKCPENKRKRVRLNVFDKNFMTDASFSVMRSLMTNKGQLTFSHDWHQNSADHVEAMSFGDLEKGDTWTPLIGSVDLGNGVVARELHSVSSLHNQGAKERHCVGTYAHKVVLSDTYRKNIIFSLENQEGILSTAQVLVSFGREEKVEVKIVQHKTKNNSEPEKGVQELAQALMSHINTKLSKSDLDEYLKSLSEFAKDNSLFTNRPWDERIIAFSPWNEKKMDVALREYGAYLAKPYRGMSVEEMIMLSAFDFLEKDFVPSTDDLPFTPEDEAELTEFGGHDVIETLKVKLAGKEDYYDDLWWQPPV